MTNIDNSSSLLISDFRKHINLSIKDQIIMDKNLKKLDKSSFRSYKEGFNKLVKLNNKEKLVEYIHFSYESKPRKLIDKSSKFKSDHVGLLSYPVNKIKENASSLIIKALALSTVSTTLFPTTLAVVLSGASLAVGVLSHKIASDSWRIMNKDLVMINNKIEKTTPENDLFLQRLVKGSKNIPINIKNKDITIQKEYLSDIISAFCAADRYTKRILRTQNFDVIVELFEETKKSLNEDKKDNITIKDLSLSYEGRIKADKNYVLLLNHIFLEHFKENKEFQKNVIDGVNKLDLNDIKDVSDCINKSVNLISTNLMKSLPYDKMSQSINSINGVNLNEKQVTDFSLKIFEFFIDFNVNEKGSEFLYNNTFDKYIVTPSLDNFKKTLFDVLKDEDNAGVIKNIVGNLTESDIQPFISGMKEAISNLSQLKIKKDLEELTEKIEQQTFENRSLSDKLKEKNWEDNKFGKMAIKALDKITELMNEFKKEIKMSLSDDALNMAKKVKSGALNFASGSMKVLSTLTKCLSFPTDLFSNYLPVGLSKFINSSLGDKKIINDFNNSILNDNKLGISMGSMLAKKIKQNKNSDLNLVKNKFNDFIERSKKENDINNSQNSANNKIKIR